MESLEAFYERYRAGMESMKDLKELDEFFGLPWMVITPDGQSFYGVRPVARTVTPFRRISLVFNWFEDLQGPLPAAR